MNVQDKGTCRLPRPLAERQDENDSLPSFVTFIWLCIVLNESQSKTYGLRTIIGKF
uniref:Uncharacterized protein n=1 Tax=Romanomermis culicivorax TaxID=13658 RepID=A0A915J2T5_ROMCU